MAPHEFMSFHRGVWVLLIALATLGSGCQTITAPPPGAPAARRGDEIVVAGQFFHTGTPVVLWMDPGGYDAYRVERRFSPLDEADWETSRASNRNLSSPNRYGLRRAVLTAEQAERVRGGGWDLPLLQSVVDQFVIHYDASGTSRNCFRTLHDLRDLSIHFMLDLDGTIYQTLDLKERAWHATTSNSRSVGIEIANVGAFPPSERNPFPEWFAKEADGRTRIIVPERLGESGLRAPGFVGRPIRIESVRGSVQGQELVQYDFTPEQYDALVKLTATLCRVLPKIRCDYPRDASGRLVTHKLPDDQLNRYQGLLGHYHIQTNKVDPGPAFQWDYVVTGARRLLEESRPRQIGSVRKQ
jgi:N-acetyl-anhydromuramyl-L-alanine amidase AmpD